MIDELQIKRINDAIEAFFREDSSLGIVPAKILMPTFIKAGIFAKDLKNGKPIRDVLREMDKAQQLDRIPYVHAERQEKNTYWYFKPGSAEAPVSSYKQEAPSAEKETARQAHSESDENYVLDLCDRVLEATAERQKRFPFLLGDLHQDGRSRTQLPVDAYYPRYKLVVVFKELSGGKKDDSIKKSRKKTASGVDRERQRAIYDQRRATELPKNGIELLQISLDRFELDAEHKIIRNPAQDLLKVKKLLKDVARD